MKNSREKRRSLFAIAIALELTLAPLDADAFPHVVRKGETLAAIAERYYGKIQFERVLALENQLEVLGPSALTPGFLLEVPTLRYHRVARDETWEGIATAYLGAPNRGAFVAQSNGVEPWIPPELGRVLAIPHQLALPLRGGESLATLAYRYLSSTKEAYRLAVYNGLQGEKLERGGLLFVPLSDLPLTPEGERARRAYADSLVPPTESDPRVEGAAHEVVLREVHRDVLGGRYVQSVARGERLLAQRALPDAARAKLSRDLLTAYVALEQRALALTACQEMRRLAPSLVLDEITTSPKELALCPEPGSAAPDPESLAP